MALSVVASLTVVQQLSERLVVAIDGELSLGPEPVSEQVITGLEHALDAIREVLCAIEDAHVAIQQLHARSAAMTASSPSFGTTDDGRAPGARGRLNCL